MYDAQVQVEHPDAVIAGVRDIEVSVVVHGHVYGAVEDCRGPRPPVARKPGLSGSGHRGDDALGVHHPDPMVPGICDVQAAPAVYRNALGSVQRGHCGLASVTGVTLLKAAGDGGDDAAGVHLSDPVIEALRDPDVTRWV